MEGWRPLLIACAIAITTLISSAAAEEDTITPEEAAQYIRSDQKIYAVLDAIRLNSSQYVNYMVSKDDNTTLLMHAAYHGQDVVVSELVKYGADVNAVSRTGRTAMIMAIVQHDSYRREKYNHIVNILLAASADVELPKAPLWNALHWAAYHNGIQIIKSLLTKKPNVNRVDSKGKTPLMIAAERGHNAVQTLIDAGADVNIQDFEGETALTKCIENNYYSNTNDRGCVCDLLLKAKANTELPKAPKSGPLHLAAYLNLPYMIESLVKAGADVDRVDAKGRTPLLVAAERGNTVLEILLEAGSDVNHEDNDGETALTKTIEGYTSSYNKWDINFEVLMRSNANVELPAYPAWGPLHYAAYEDAPYMVKSLINASAQINRVDSKGRTPLIVAAERGNKVARELIKAGADLDHKDNNGDTAMVTLIDETYSNSLENNIILDSLLKANASVELPASPASGPLHLAAENGLLYMVQALIDAKANINRLDSTGRTPMIVACEENEAVLQPFIDAGAKVDIQDNEGATALLKNLESLYYWRYDYDESVKNLDNLLDASARVDLPAKPAKSPLHLAAEHGSTYVVKQLISSDADVNRTDGTGKTPLLIAAEDLREVVDVLIVAGSDVDHIDNEGETALIKACKNYDKLEQHVVVDYLLARGADVNKRTSTKKTALHYAVMRYSLYVTRRLLEEGASVDAVDSEGHTALLSAEDTTSRVRPAMVELLLAGGSNIKHEGNTDGTILHLLANRRDETSTKVAMRFCPDLTVTNNNGKTAIEIATDNGDNDVLDALRAEYIAACPHDLKVYDKGDVRCESNKAYECTDKCTWKEVDIATSGCAPAGRHRRQLQLNSTEEYISPTTNFQPISYCTVTCQSTDGEPVCGSDGITYGSRCEYLRASCDNPSIKIVGEGHCVTTPGSCETECKDEYDPVCGSDGKTYKSRCSLEAVRDCNFPSLTAIRDGPCDTTTPSVTPDPCDLNCSDLYVPVCGSNGITYGNDCILKTASCKDPSIRKAKNGKCDTKKQVGMDKYVNVDVNVY